MLLQTTQQLQLLPGAPTGAANCFRGMPLCSSVERNGQTCIARGEILRREPRQEKTTAQPSTSRIGNTPVDPYCATRM